MKTQTTSKLLWEEISAFFLWAMPALWSMFTDSKPNEEEPRVTGAIQTDDGYIFTTYSDGTTDSGPPGIKGPFV